MKRELGWFYLKPTFRLLVVASIIAFTVTLSQCSCGKTPAAGGSNNSGSRNNGGNNGGGGGCTGICPTGTLTLTSEKTWAKISGNTITINATSLAGEVTPLTDIDDADRGFFDVSDTLGLDTTLFKVNYPSATAALVFVNRTHVTKDNITFPATVPYTAARCSSSESGDNLLAQATGGGACRTYDAGQTAIYSHSYLGTVFNNTDAANRARGLMLCSMQLDNNVAVNDTTVFTELNHTVCSMAVVNNGLARTVEIDDAWVGDAASTSEVELYAIGIDVSGKTISQFSDAPGYNLAAFIGAHDNADFKRLLQNNPWGELKFKVKIVKNADF